MKSFSDCIAGNLREKIVLGPRSLIGQPDQNKILDKNTGAVLLKCATKLKNGNLGQFSEPRITHTGFDGSLMVADPGNRCLQVKTLTGDWGIVPMEFACYRPSCALLYRKDLFVGQGAEPYKIFRYI